MSRGSQEESRVKSRESRAGRAKQPNSAGWHAIELARKRSGLRMKSILRSISLVSVVLLVPVVPFLLFGPILESWLEQLVQEPMPIWLAALTVVGLLSTDILLPVPSSLISTLGGWQLGWQAGTLFSWIGMNVGAVLGFGLARKWGRPFALRLSRSEDLRSMQLLSDRYGPFVLVLTRAVPILAEASVLLLGIHRLAWKRFLPPVLLSNLGIALAYSAFGNVAQRHNWLPLALGVAVALPVVLAMLLKLIWRAEKRR